MHPTHRLQFGGAAKEIILVLAFLIFVAYLAVTGAKSTLGITEPSSAASTEQVLKASEVTIRAASLAVGLGSGLMLASAIFSLMAIERFNRTNQSEAVATALVKASGTVGILSGICAVAGGSMYYFSSVTLGVGLILLGVVQLGVAIYGLAKS
jgi:hypothetical protein